MSRYSISLAEHAQNDLIEIADYIDARDGEEQAGAVLDVLRDAIISLQSMPERGNRPPELKRLGMGGMRELHVNGFRLLYQVSGQNVYVVGIISARRDVQAQLAERVLR